MIQIITLFEYILRYDKFDDFWKPVLIMIVNNEKIYSLNNQNHNIIV